ncbi:hypothetical protein, partial [Phascolarctobacterium succinatutens]|uniref:hypothetical protein n=1 Tax=Phascolarctobacterium succinatutens TaxID=626940 RepID=UPI003AF7C75E
ASTLTKKPVICFFQNKNKYYFCPLSLHNSLRQVKITLQKPLSSHQSLCYNLLLSKQKLTTVQPAL